MTTSAQITALTLYAAFIGVFIGMIYDVFRIMRIALPSKIKNTALETVIVFFQDILFWLIAGIVFIIFLYYTNKGHTRIVMIADALIGFFLYHFTVGRIVVRFSGQIIRFIKFILNIIYKISVKPLIFIITRVIMFVRSRIIGFHNKRTLGRILKLSGNGYGI